MMPTVQEQLFEDFVHFAAQHRSAPSSSVTAPVRPARLCLCRLSFPGEGSFTSRRDRPVSPAGGRFYGVQDVCREP